MFGVKKLTLDKFKKVCYNNYRKRKGVHKMEILELVFGGLVIAFLMVWAIIGVYVLGGKN